LSKCTCSNPAGFKVSVLYMYTWIYNMRICTHTSMRSAALGQVVNLQAQFLYERSQYSVERALYWVESVCTATPLTRWGKSQKCAGVMYYLLLCILRRLVYTNPNISVKCAGLPAAAQGCWGIESRVISRYIETLGSILTTWDVDGKARHTCGYLNN